jgi:hypothetical protein
MFQMGKLLKGQIFSSGAKFFRQTGRKSLPRVGNTGCALCVQWGGGAHLPNRFCLSTVYILRQESVIKYVAVFKVITGSNLCLRSAHFTGISLNVVREEAFMFRQLSVSAPGALGILLRCSFQGVFLAVCIILLNFSCW